MIRICIFLWCLVALPHLVLAATSDFSVRTTIGDDTTPPGTPTLLTAEAVASSQIDITWSPVSDDYQLGGYTIARDGVHIATTTLTSFSDTSLTAETLYEYTVRAFDWVFNVSSSSNALSTTTLAVAVPPPTPTSTVSTSTGATGSGKLLLRSNLRITTDVTSAVFTWETNRPSRFELRWGRTASYELGFVTTERYSEKHLTSLTELIPGTTYEYELIGYNTINTIPQVLAHGQFTTDVPADATPPPNVSRLTADVWDEAVSLRWQNPPLTAGSYIRILRSHLGYPMDLHDGVVVYQGRDENFYDAQALAQYQTQFYTVFVVNDTGAVSSGAVVRAERGGGVATWNPVLEPSTAPPAPPPDMPLPLLDRSHIQLTQEGAIMTFADPEITLSSRSPFTLSIPKAALPPHLKSIIVTLLDPSDHRQSYPFLLRLNRDGTAYETTLAPLSVSGVSQLVVEIYDFETAVVGRYGKQINFVALGTSDQVLFPDAFVPGADLVRVLYALLVIVLGLLIGLWWRHRRRQRAV